MPSTGWRARWANHYELRLSYERAMLENEGGRAGESDIEPGGFVFVSGCRGAAGEWRQVEKVNKSPATKRATSVMARNSAGKLSRVDVSRMAADSYRAPTDTEREEFASAQKAAKAAERETEPAA